MKINSISSTDTEYPLRLRNIPAKPHKLFFRGVMPDDSRTFVAIVGTRKPTNYGIDITNQLARKLSERGVVIISGLALGIDAIAHKGALAGKGTTLAVMGCGVDQIYPATNRALGEQVLKENGAIISEYEPGMPVMQHQFLERNRIVSGLSDALIVTEAATHSGTFNTVSHALEQGKDVYALPGPITSPMSRGCNQLIAQGATPINDVDEFVNTIAPRIAEVIPTLAYSDAEQIIIDLIKQGSRDGEELHAKSQLEAGHFAQTLTMLELRGAIRPLGANQWSL